MHRMAVSSRLRYLGDAETGAGLVHVGADGLAPGVALYITR